MYPLLANIRDRSIILLTLNYCAGQLLYRLRLRKHLSGATHRKYSVEEGAAYVRRVFDDYLAVSGVSREELAGKHILEVGPGDNLGVALLFAAHGAAEVCCLDRFGPARDEIKNRAIYRELLASLPVTLPGNGKLLASDGSLIDHRITVLTDLPIETAATTLEGRRYDYIVSRAVLEHVFDLRAAWASMDALLVPGGLSIHKVDFRSHGFYDSLHRLAFLRVPSFVWNLVSSPDPTLNRLRTDTYDALASQYGYNFSIDVTHFALTDTELPLGSLTWPIDLNDRSERDLDAIRRQLAKPFKTSSLESLAVAGIFIVARKSRTRAAS